MTIKELVKEIDELNEKIILIESRKYTFDFVSIELNKRRTKLLNALDKLMEGGELNELR
jgi:hypothetical protein